MKDKIKGSLTCIIYKDICLLQLLPQSQWNWASCLRSLFHLLPVAQDNQDPESSPPQTPTHDKYKNICRRIKSCCSHQRALTQWQHLCGKKRSNKHSCTDSIATEPEQHLSKERTGSINIISIETPLQHRMFKSKLTSALLTITQNTSVYPSAYLLGWYIEYSTYISKYSFANIGRNLICF